MYGAGTKWVDYYGTVSEPHRQTRGPSLRLMLALFRENLSR